MHQSWEKKEHLAKLNSRNMNMCWKAQIGVKASINTATDEKIKLQKKLSKWQAPTNTIWNIGSTQTTIENEKQKKMRIKLSLTKKGLPSYEAVTFSWILTHFPHSKMDDASTSSEKQQCIFLLSALSVCHKWMRLSLLPWEFLVEKTCQVTAKCWMPVKDLDWGKINHIPASCFIYNWYQYNQHIW